jgi:hypothetical protein
MSFISKGGGVTALSALNIDADKDWNAKGISNIAFVAAGMQVGEMCYFDGAGIVRFTPGPAGTVLTTQGLGADPTWSHP